MIDNEIFGKFFLFKGLSDVAISALLSEYRYSYVDFCRGETVCSRESSEKRIGFLIDGRCEVRHNRSDGSVVVINVLSEGESFGLLSAFSENEFPTEIVATKTSKIVFFDKEDVIRMIRSNGQISMNVIDFMVNRIEFLNSKIVTFSGGNVEKKLSSYILSEAKKNGDFFNFNRKKAAEAISAGRASVYRALDSFTQEELIKYDSKKIYILDREGLERISK